MKLKHFMFALVAMLSCFTFTANAQTEGTTNDVEEAALFGDDEYFVNCDYTSSTSGWGKTRFSNYDAAFAVAKSATLAKYRSATIIIEKTNTISGNCLADEHDGYAKLAVVVKAGATIGVAISKWDMTYPVTVEPGGAIVSARGKSSGYINSHIKNTLTIGSNGAGEKAVLDFLGGSYQSGSVSIMYNGNIVANNAIIEVGDFGLSGTGTFNNCDINVGGVLATGKNDYYKQTMTNTTVTVGGTNYQNENTYYSTEGTLLHNLTLDNSTIAIGNGDGVVVKTVTLKNGSAWTVAEGASVNTTNAKVTVYGSVEVPKELENNSAANELVSNTAVSGYTPTLPAGVTNLTVELTEVEATAEATTKVTFNVEPKNASGQKVSNPSDEITFRLPVPAAWAGKANVYHEGTLLGAYTIKEESGAKYVEVSSANFSEFSIKAVLFDGEGTEASPYIIDSSDKLAALRNEVNGGEAYEGVYFKLTSDDITLSGEWTAIGNGSRNGTGYTGNAFKGVFDGDNNTISGLTITSTTGAKAAIGLFGVVDGGTVKNLNLTDVNINVPSSDLAGAAIGMMLRGATAEAITVSGAIVGHDGVGGIVGRLIIDGTIANCTNNASVTSSYGGIGGIVGKPYYDDASNTSIFAKIDNCTNNGTITAPMYVGGIAGLARANVTNCVNEGAIVGGTQTGGIIGQLMAAGTVSGNENKAKVSGKNHLGGIIGDYSQSSDYHYYNVTIANNINRGELAATEQCAAILGCNNIDGFTAMTATGNQSFYFVEGLELFGNPEDMVIDATNKFIVPVAQVGAQTFYTFADAAAAANAGSEIKLLANIDGDITVPANVTLNGNGFAVSGGIFAEGDITFAGVTTAADFDANVANTAVNIPAGASLQLTGTARLVIGHGATFNITGTIEDAKTADKATLVPSLKIAAGASITGNGVTFNVNNAYIVANANTTSKNSNANGTLDFNINNSIWEQTGVLAFYVPTSGKDPVVNFELKNSVLTTTSHLVFSVTKGEIVIDNSLVNQGTSRQIENRSTMTIKNGSVVNGAVATSSNAINPGTIIVENATYAVTGEFSGAAEGTGTLIIKKGATVSAGSITKANIKVDAEGMTAADEINLTANLSKLAGELSVINNDNLEAQIVDGKVVLAAKPVAKIGEQGYATLEAAFKAATSGCTIDILSDVTVDYNWDARYTGGKFTVPVTINGNGKTIKFTASVNDPNYQAPFRFEADATVKNLTIDMSEVTDSRFRAISSKGNLTVDGCKFIGKDESLNCRAIIFGEGAGANVGNLAISITNSEFINWKRGITDNENAQDVKTVTITGNTLKDAAVYVSATSNVTFTDNTVAGAYVNIKSYTANNKLAVTATGNTLEANTETAYNVINAGGKVEAEEGFNVVAKGGSIIGYTGTDGIWGETWGNARESFVIKVVDAQGNVMGTTSLKNIDGIIDGDVTVSWNIKFNAAANTDEYWTMSWTTAPSINNMPAKVQLWVDGTKVSEGNVVLNGPDNLWPIAVAVTDENGVIKSCAQTLEAAVAAGNNVAILKAGTYALKVKDGLTITGAVEGVEFANIGAFGCNGADVTFNNVTFTYAENSTYKGLQHSGNLVYNNCTFNGQVFLYGQSETFNNCTFNTTDAANYNVWTYGAKEVAFNECTFNSAGKSVLIYAESASVTNNVTVTKSTFNASQTVDGKAAIEMDASLTAGINLTIDAATTATGFAAGNVSGNSLWNNKKGNADDANNDITVVVDGTTVLAPVYEAKIGEKGYRKLTDAINAVKDGETIVLVNDYVGNVTLTEKAGLHYTIDGNGKKFNGTISLNSLSDTEDNRRITIKNINFEDAADANVDFISSVNTNHYPRLTVEGCTFTGSGNDGDVAIRLKSSHSVVIKDCTGTGLHSFLQNTSGWNLTIENVKVTDSKSGFALGTVQGVTVKGCEIAAEGYGIRLDAGYNNNAVIESNKVEAFIPVVVRKATVDSNIAIKGENEFTASNTDGLWMAVGTSEYEKSGGLPTAATGQVVVTLKDTNLDNEGIYGDHVVLAGKGTEAEPYLISDIKELVAFRNYVNSGANYYAGVWVALAADIDMAGENWIGIGSATADHGFMGNFDGKNFKIKNLTITNPALDSDGYAYAGLFGVTEGTDKDNQNTIKNLTIENVTITTTGHIAAAAIAYPYYTIVDNVKVCGDIEIQGGDYTAGALAYTRRCVNASNIMVSGNDGSYVEGNQVVGGVISDIQMNGGLTAVYNNFSAEGITVSGKMRVGGISGIIATQTLNGATVKNVTLNSEDKFAGVVAGCLGGTSTITNVVAENVTGATTLIGATYDAPKAVQAKIGDTYYATLDAALAAEGNEVELLATYEVAAGETKTLDLKGKTVTMVYTAKATKNHTMVSNSGNLTIESSVEGGKLSYTYAGENLGTSYSANTVTSNPGSVLTVKSGTIENLTFDSGIIAYAIDGLTNGGAGDVTVNIEGGVITSKRQAVRIFANSTTNTGALNISGGDITGRVIVQNASAKANKAALNVTGGTFNANDYKTDVLYVGGSSSAEIDIKATVSGGTFKGEITETNVAGFISGGTFANPVAAQFCAEGFMPNKNVDGTYGVVLAEDVVASIDGVTYETLAAAVEAAQAGATVDLLADVTLAGGYTDAAEGLRIEKEITLNGNNHTIDCGNFQKGIRVYNPSNVGDFNVNFNNVKVVNKVANGRCIDTRSGNINLKVNSSTLIATNGNSQPLTIGGDDPVHRVTLNETTIDAGTSGYAVISFVSTNVDIQGVNNSTISGYAAFYLKGDAKTTNLNLGQGVYTGINNHAIESGMFGTVVLEGDNNVVQLMGTNATVKAIAENTAPQAAFLVRGANNTIKVTKESAKIITEGNAYEAIVDADNAATTKFIDMGIERKLVAEVGGYQFYSFEEAVRFAGNEGTIKVVNDFVLAEAWTIPAGMEYTIDLNGKTVSYTSAVAGEDMITNRGNLTITDSSDAKTGKLAYVNTDDTASNVTVSTISTEAGSTLVVDGGTIENKTVKADGSSIYSYAIDILTNGSLGDVNVTINGGTVYSDYMAIRQFNNGTACKNSLTINGGYIYGAKRAVQVHMDNNAAVTAIKGGKVEAGAEGYALCNFAATSDLAVTGGEFIGAVYSARENFISGGIYDAEVYAGYCAEGYMPNKNVDGKYGVVLVANAYASIDGVTYGSLKAAINAAKAGETITLLQNVNENVTISKNLTLDGAGKTITGMITTDGKGLKITIKNVKFDGNNNTINYAMRADDNNKLVVENCTVNNYIYGFLYANKSNDKVVVKNVTVENCAEYGAYLVAVNSASFENFTVKGATKYGIVVANAGARTVNLENVTFEDAEQPLHINEIGTGKVTFNFSGSNDMSKAEFYTSQYVKVVAAAQVGTRVCGSLQDAVVAANDGETVKVLGDLNMTTANFVTQVDGYATLVNVAGKAVTIDLNGKKVTVNAAHADLNGKATGNMLMSVFHADPNGTLILTDSSAEGTGTVELFANDATVYALIVSENANDKSNPGKIIVNGGNYIADRLSDSMIFADINEVITVNGGNFHLDNVGEGPKGNGSPWIFNASGNNQMHINVNGGTYNADVAKQHWTYEVNLGEGLTTTNNGDGTWTVVPAVATVGEETFGSIQEAIDAAQDGETVTLIADVALDTKKYTTQVDNLVVLFNVKGKAVTFDLNGKKIDVNASAANLGGKMLAGVFSADLEGNFIITDSSAEGTGAVTVTVNDAKVYSVFISENAGDKTKSGKMTVNAGNFTTVGKLANAMIYADTDKVVTINGGTFICDGVSASENYPWFVNTLHNNVMQVIVNGGTFNIDINHQYRPFEVFVPENLAVKANGNGTWTIVPAQAYVTEMLGEWVDEPGSREHKVGYATVAEAFAAVKSGETVTMVADAALTETVVVPAGKEVVLDLNGKTISANIAEQLTKSFAAIQNRGALTVKDASADADGKISVSYAGNSFGYGVGLYTISNEGGVLNIEGGTIENTTTVSGSMYDAIDNNSTLGETVLNISGGEVLCGQYIGVRQFANNTTYDNIVNVTGGKVVGGNTSIWMQNPNSNANKATVSISGADYENGNYPVIKGRLLAGESTGFNFEVTGGLFDTDVNAFCATDYASYNFGDGTWGVEYLYIDDLTIVDGEYDEFENQNAKTVGRLTYKRQFNEKALNKWQPLFVPFEIPVSELGDNYEVAYFNDFRETIVDGVIVGNPVVEMIKITSGTLRANHPYVIKPKNAAALEMTLEFENVILFATTTDKRHSVECSSATKRFEFLGSYKKAGKIELTGDSEGLTPCYIMNTSGDFGTLSNTGKLGAFRVYLTITNKDGSPYIKDEHVARTIVLRVVGEENEDGTTFIYDVENDAQTVDYIYDLQGRRVLEPQKGNLYIINGKKVIF